MAAEVCRCPREQAGRLAFVECSVHWVPECVCVLNPLLSDGVDLFEVGMSWTSDHIVQDDG